MLAIVIQKLVLILIVTNTCVYSVSTFLSGVVNTGLSIAHLVSGCQSGAKYEVSPFCSGCLQYIFNPEYVAIEPTHQHTKFLMLVKQSFV